MKFKDLIDKHSTQSIIKMIHELYPKQLEIIKDGIMVSFYNDTMFMGETLITWSELQ